MDEELKSVELVRHNMRRLRLEKKLTQQEWGEILGFSQDSAGRYVSQIETGARNPTFEQIDILCEKYGLTRDYFFTIPVAGIPAKAEFATEDGTVFRILSPRGNLSEEAIQSLRNFADFVISKESKKQQNS